MAQERSLKDLFTLLFGICALLYPFLVYWGMGQLSPRALAAVVLVFAVIRMALVYGMDRETLRQSVPLIVAIVVSCVVAIALNNSRFLMFTPVFISLAFLVAIGQSLIWPPTFIETFARKDFPILPPSAERYCRKVTWAWCIYLAFNAVVSLLLALFAKPSWWALYTGFLSYVGMGLLFGIEFLIRKRIEPVFAADLEAMTAESEA